MREGIVLGKVLPGVTDGLRRLKFAQDRHINVPIAVFNWLLITPKMTKVDFASVKIVGKLGAGS